LTARSLTLESPYRDPRIGPEIGRKHDVPKRDVLRRFKRGWENFQKTYQPMAESWAVYDNSGASPQLMERQE